MSMSLRAPMRAVMTPALRMQRSISPESPLGWPAWLLAAPADSRDPASSTKAFTCTDPTRTHGQYTQKFHVHLPCRSNSPCTTSAGAIMANTLQGDFPGWNIRKNDIRTVKLSDLVGWREAVLLLEGDGGQHFCARHAPGYRRLLVRAGAQSAHDL